MNLTLRFSEVVDRVLVVTDDDIFDAPGNIGDGRRNTLALDVSLPLDGIGFHGGRLTSSMQWRRSRVTDPRRQHRTSGAGAGGRRGMTTGS